MRIPDVTGTSGSLSWLLVATPEDNADMQNTGDLITSHVTVLCRILSAKTPTYLMETDKLHVDTNVGECHGIR